MSVTTWFPRGHHSPSDIAIGDLYVNDSKFAVILTKRIMTWPGETEPTVNMTIWENSQIKFLILPVCGGISKAKHVQKD